MREEAGGGRQATMWVKCRDGRDAIKNGPASPAGPGGRDGRAVYSMIFQLVVVAIGGECQVCKEIADLRQPSF